MMTMMMGMRCLSRQTRTIDVVRGLSRVGLQRRFFKYDGRLPKQVAYEGTTTTGGHGGPFLVVCAVGVSLFALNRYQSRARQKLEEETKNIKALVSSFTTWLNNTG